MPVVRILIDGYSLLHRWTELAAGRPRYSEQARDELISAVKRYQDGAGVPVTIVFDGRGSEVNVEPSVSTRDMEVLFSKAGQTADQVIERVAHLLSAYGEVMVVTDDLAERGTIVSVGGSVISCANFISMVGETLREIEGEIAKLNKAIRLKLSPGWNRS